MARRGSIYPSGGEVEMETTVDFVVLGAGLAGLTAASTLLALAEAEGAIAVAAAGVWVVSGPRPAWRVRTTMTTTQRRCAR